MNEGDWVEGAPQWWWRYVLPAQEEFWRLIAYGGPDTDPTPDPWKQASISLLEAVVLVCGISRTAERDAKTRLHQEAVQKLQSASKALGRS
jgi:hypothetical protein